MNSYFSPIFLGVFFPACVLVYQLTPRCFRWAVLLLFSYAFFWAISGKLLVFLLVSTVSIWAVGLWMEKVQAARKAELAEAAKEQKKAIKARYTRKLRWIVFLGVIFNLGILIVIKYTPFFASALNGFFAAIT